jgi:arsenite methyltransferase
MERPRAIISTTAGWNMSQLTATKPADYGIDAPGVLRGLFSGGAIALIAGVIVSRASQATLSDVVSIWMIFIGLGCLGTASIMLWSSKVGKFRMRDRLIDSIKWRGDEKVLDVGCGHGLLLIAAAKRLKTGKAIGVDIWSQVDQGSNRPEATIENAEFEGVADRIEVKDGDARHLPFEDNSFDVVVSSLVIHNIRDRAGRDEAVREIARVLRPGGRIAIHDMAHLTEYAQVLRDNGVGNTQFSERIFLFNVFTHILTANKPT